MNEHARQNPAYRAPLKPFLKMSTNRKKAFKAKDYLATETGTIFKRQSGSPAVALVYPNTYYLGMSNLGFQTLYALFNQDTHTVCERVFLPDEQVLSQSYTQKIKTLEHGRELGEQDCIAFSISFENDYLYVPQILQLSGLPLYASNRSENDPIVIAGGAAITINPEPIRPFLDAFFVGEAEEATQEIIDVLRSGLKREQKILELAKIEGMYIGQHNDFESVLSLPASICPTNPKPNSLEQRVPLAHLRHYKRRVPKDVNGFAVETQIYTPYSEFGKLSLIEVQRGCGRGCKFCAEGFIYTPFRERDFSLIKSQVKRGLTYRNKIGLIGADLLVYPQILELMRFIHDNGGTFSPSSVRVDALNNDIIQELVTSGHKTLAIAPEAGSVNLRRNINKKFDNNTILEKIDALISAGIPNIKMYVMIGLPHETAQDIDELIELVKETRQTVLKHAKINKKVGSLVLSINPFIPKPRTPYQVGNFAGIAELESKLRHIKKTLMPLGGIRIYHENPFFAYIQALLSNGQTHLSDFLIEVMDQKGSLKKALRVFEENGRHQPRRISTFM